MQVRPGVETATETGVPAQALARVAPEQMQSGRRCPSLA